MGPDAQHVGLMLGLAGVGGPELPAGARIEAVCFGAVGYGRAGVDGFAGMRRVDQVLAAVMAAPAENREVANALVEVGGSAVGVRHDGLEGLGLRERAPGGVERVRERGAGQRAAGRARRRGEEEDRGGGVAVAAARFGTAIRPSARPWSTRWASWAWTRAR